MEVNGLFSDEIEADLRTWLSGFGNLGDLYAGLPQLFAKLDAQQLHGTVEENVSIIGPAHVGARSHVRTGSLLLGPAIIAEDATISSSTEIGEFTYIGSGCKISHAACIRNSLILNGTVIGAGAYVRDSVIGTRCVVGPHACIGVEPMNASGKGQLRSQFVVMRSGARVGASAILELGAVLAEDAVVDHGTLVSHQARSTTRRRR